MGSGSGHVKTCQVEHVVPVGRPQEAQVPRQRPFPLLLPQDDKYAVKKSRRLPVLVHQVPLPQYLQVLHGLLDGDPHQAQRRIDQRQAQLGGRRVGLQGPAPEDIPLPEVLVVGMLHQESPHALQVHFIQHIYGRDRQLVLLLQTAEDGIHLVPQLTVTDEVVDMRKSATNDGWVMQIGFHSFRLSIYFLCWCYSIFQQIYRFHSNRQSMMPILTILF